MNSLTFIFSVLFVLYSAILFYSIYTIKKENKTIHYDPILYFVSCSSFAINIFIAAAIAFLSNNYYINIII